MNTTDTRKGRSRQLLQGVKHLWEEGLLCDAALETEDGHRYGVHRAVLAAVSDYFMAMFTRDMQERATTSSICLKGVSGHVLELLLSYVYTGEMALASNTVVEVAAAAAYLQLECAVSHCFRFALNMIGQQNCVDVYNAARAHTPHTAGQLAKELEEKALTYICDHFHQVMGNGLHYRLDCDTLMKCLMLKDDEGWGVVSVGPEIELFHYLTGWCKANNDDRPLNEIRYPLMAATDLSVALDTVRKEGFSCGDAIEEAQRYTKFPMLDQIALCYTENHKVRNRPCIFTLAHGGSYKNLRMFILSTPEGSPPPAEKKQSLTWMQVPELNHNLHEDMIAQGFRPHSWALVQGFLVVLGQVPRGRLRCFVFNPRTLKWSTMPAMTVPRTHCPLVECDGELFALGGITLEGGITSGTIEKYSFVTHQWSVVGQMGVPLEGHGACSIGDKIYVYGGRLANGQQSQCTYTYDPGESRWEAVSSSTLLPESNSLQLQALLARIYSAESSGWGMTHYQQPGEAAGQHVKQLKDSNSHFAVVLTDSVVFIGGTLPEVKRRRPPPHSSNVNKCVQVIAKERQGLGDSVPQPDYPKGWRPCLAVGLNLPWDAVRQAHPVHCDNSNV